MYENFLSAITKTHWKRLGTHKRSGVATPLFSIYSKQSIGIGEIRGELANDKSRETIRVLMSRTKKSLARPEFYRWLVSKVGEKAAPSHYARFRHEVKKQSFVVTRRPKGRPNVSAVAAGGNYRIDKGALRLKREIISGSNLLNALACLKPSKPRLLDLSVAPSRVTARFPALKLSDCSPGYS